MKNEKFISLIFGGTSGEHSISLKTAGFMYETLLKLNPNIQPVFISKTNKWFFKTSPPFFFSDKIDDPLEFEKDFLKKNNLTQQTHPSLLNSKMVFLGLHGGEGEDGTIQGFLKTLNIPFVGSDMGSSFTAMNKMLANQVFYNQNLNVPKSEIISKKKFQNNPQICKIDFPIFAKPISGGSSLSSSIINNQEEFEEKLSLFFENETQDYLLQEYISGKEFTCGVIENKDGAMALPVTEIQPKSNFFDFEAKYKQGKEIETTPANIDEKITKKIQDMSVMAHKALKCKDFSRSDFIIANKKIYILEVNTLPGMTENSFLPQQLAAANIEITDFFQYFIEKYS